MPNILTRVRENGLDFNKLTSNQQARYARQLKREVDGLSNNTNTGDTSKNWMKNLNLAAVPGAINNVFTGTTTVGDGYIWDAPTTGQEDGWKIASNVLGLGDSLYELAHPAYSDPSVQNYINQNKGIIDTIGANVNAGIGATSTSGLMDLISNSNYASTDYDLDQLGNDNNVGKTIGGIGKAMLKGAESGSIGGPWGALGGAATGLITGIGAAFSGAKNKKADAVNLQNQLKTRAAIANNRQSAAFQLGNSNIQSNNIRNQLMNNYNANSYGFAAYGGKLYPFGGALAGYGGDWTNGLNFINNGGTHEENPYEGVPVSIAQDGQPNLVEEGEVVWNDYVFSNRLEVPKEVMDQLKLGKGKKTFAEVVEKVQKEASERPNDPIAKRGLEDSLQKLAAIQEQIRAEQEQQNAYNQAEDTAAMYADGGPIHIAKNKRGTFTAAATKNGMGVQEFAKHVLANKDKYSTNMVKKAVFAHNANSWEHGYGGYLADPYIQYALGGHIAANGMLFSSTNPPVRWVAKTPGGYMLSPAEVVAAKPSAQTIPSFNVGVTANDPQLGIQTTIPEILSKPVQLPVGLTAGQPTQFINTVSNNWSPGAGLNMPSDYPDLKISVPGTANIGDEPRQFYIGPTKLDPWGATDSYQKWKNSITNNNNNLTFTSEDYQRAIENRNAASGIGVPSRATTTSKQSSISNNSKTSTSKKEDINKTITVNDPIITVPNPEDMDMSWLTPEAQEEFYKTINPDPYTPIDLNKGKNKDKTKGKTKFDESWLRYAPVLGSAIGAMASLFDKPDMEYANAIERAGREAAGKLKDVKAKPIGDYLAYNPFDRLFYSNQLAAQSSAQRRAIENAANGNVGAALAGLANADYNADVALGQLYRQGEEYNLAQRHKVAEFNRGTNMFNSQEDLRAQMANAQTAVQRAQIINQAIAQAAALKLGEKNRIQEARSLNLTNFFDNLGNIGWEAVNRNMINSNKALYYYMSANGISSYKGATEDQKDEIAAMLGRSRKETDKIGAQYDRENKNN